MAALGGESKTAKHLRREQADAAKEAARRLCQADAATFAAKHHLPFVVHPFAITDVTHQAVRTLHVAIDDEGKWMRLPISSCQLATGELYADLCPRRKTLRLWSSSLWTSPLVLYRCNWEWATKAHDASQQAARQAPSWSDDQSESRKAALEAFAAADHVSLHSSPNGLSVLATDLQWPFDLPLA